MKIGILSMQKILNYGSFLQAFSLKKQFEMRGHDVYFIDIEPGRCVASKKAEKKSLLSKMDRYAVARLKNYFLYRKMAEIHKNDYTKFLETEKKLPVSEKFDLVVIGSDEVFNAAIPSAWGFSPQLFGKINNAKHIATYAASCGSTTLADIKRLKIDGEIREALKRVEKLSVRDDNTFDFITDLTNIQPQKNIDPVFLTDYSEYIPKTERKKPYMLIYAYGNRIEDENEIRAIQAYAKEKNLDVLCVGMQQRWCRHNIPATAFELLSYVQNAACVVTDTFHGTVFSIKYNKQFVSIVRDSNKNKLSDLLSVFKLRDRELKKTQDLREKMDSEIDFKEANAVLSAEQNKSCSYLDMLCGRAAR